MKFNPCPFLWEWWNLIFWQLFWFCSESVAHSLHPAHPVYLRRACTEITDLVCQEVIISNFESMRGSGVFGWWVRVGWKMKKVERGYWCSDSDYCSISRGFAHWAWSYFEWSIEGVRFQWSSADCLSPSWLFLIWLPWRIRCWSQKVCCCLVSLICYICYS